MTHSNLEYVSLEEGVMRRDPSDEIKVGQLYYVWYTTLSDGRDWTEKVVGLNYSYKKYYLC